MPELPEAERARAQIEKVLGREIVAVDDRDTYVCRPHAPGEIADALIGHRSRRRCAAASSCGRRPTAGRSSGCTSGWPGKIVIDGEPHERWDRFVLEFADGSRLALHDRRRLGRALINPDFDHVGPDAALISRDVFRERVGRGSMALKARLLDQSSLSGVGNLLADETLWRARLSPARVAGELTTEELDHLRRVLRAATRDAIRKGGVHTGDFIKYRKRGAPCPRCGTTVERATIGGRTTFWCPNCQP